MTGIIPIDGIQRLIYMIRDEKVILDLDAAHRPFYPAAFRLERHGLFRYRFA